MPCLGMTEMSFQAIGWHLLKGTYWGVGVHFSWPRLSNSNILCKRT